jgi:hypothetical protein
MSPAEAGMVDYEEPDWRERFADYVRAYPRPVGQVYSSVALEHNLAEEDAFERTLKDWRRFHATPVIVNGEQKRQPADAVDGVIALAKLRVFPPRSINQNLPRDGALFTGVQADDHCWLTVRQEAWAIRGVEDKTLHLWRGWAPNLEYLTIDLSRARWGPYCDKAVEFLRAAWPDFEKGGESCQGTSSEP